MTKPQRFSFSIHIKSLQNEFEFMTKEIESLRKERDEFKAKVVLQAKELDNVRRKVVQGCDKCRNARTSHKSQLRTAPVGPVQNPIRRSSPVVSQPSSSQRETLVSISSRTATRQRSSDVTQSPAEYIIESQTIASISTIGFDELLPEQNVGSVTFNPSVRKALEISMTHEMAHKLVVSSVNFSRDGRFLATVSEGVRIYEVQTGKLKCVLKNLYRKYDVVNCVRFSRNGKYLASGSSDGHIYIWDIAKKIVRTCFKPNSIAFCSLDFSPNDRLLVSGSISEAVRIWDMRYGLKMVFPGKTSHRRQVYWRSAVFSPDGKDVAVLDGEVLDIWNVKSGRMTKCVTNVGWGVTRCLAYMPDGSGLIIGSHDTLRIFDVGNFNDNPRPPTDDDTQRQSEITRSERVFSGHAMTIRSLAISFDGRWVASGSQDGTVHICDIYNDEKQCILNAGDFIYSIDFSPTACYFATGGGHMLRIWKYSVVT